MQQQAALQAPSADTILAPQALTMEEWMREADLNDQQVADMIGHDKSTVWRARTGKLPDGPSPRFIGKIIEASNGKVDANSFFKRALGKAAASREGTPRVPFNSRSSCLRGTSAARPSRRPRAPAKSSPPSPDRPASPPSSAKKSSR